MNTSEEKLKALREAASKATPGPWYAQGRTVQLQPPLWTACGAACPTVVAICITPAAATYVAEADPTTILALLDAHAALDAGAAASADLLSDLLQRNEARVLAVVREANKDIDEVHAKGQARVAELKSTIDQVRKVVADYNRITSYERVAMAALAMELIATVLGPDAG